MSEDCGHLYSNRDYEELEAAFAAAESKVDALMREKEEQIERCAKVCDDYAALQNEAWVQPGHAIRSCAWAIRALVREQQNTTQEQHDAY